MDRYKGWGEISHSAQEHPTHTHTQQNYLPQNVTSAEVEKPWFKAKLNKSHLHDYTLNTENIIEHTNPHSTMLYSMEGKIQQKEASTIYFCFT